MHVTFAPVIHSSVTTVFLASTTVCRTIQQNYFRAPQRNRHEIQYSITSGVQYSTTSSVTQTKEVQGFRASNVCSLARTNFFLPYPVFTIPLISWCIVGGPCWHRSRNFPLNGSKQIHCCLSYKVFCTQWTFIFISVASHEEMLNLPRTGSSEGLQKVLTAERRKQCLVSV